jgi:nitroimidazol reductase NimA-like FMN-containing flavoprotein (pyridoxamine 5'-phosphate oxidase superfamily)
MRVLGNIRLSLPEQVVEVLTRFHTCELATLAKDGTPIVWPTAALYLPDRGQILITTSIGLPQKAFNVRRDPRVSLLFSDPTGCGLDRPAAVLGQGDARVTDDIVIWNDDLAAFWQILRQLRATGDGHNLPREVPQAFAQAITDVEGF